MADKVIAGYAYKGYSPSVSEKDVIEIMQSTICRADNLYLNLVDGLWYFCIKDVGGNAVEPTPEFFDMNPVSLKDYAKNRKRISVDTIDDLKSRNYLTIGDIVDLNGYYTAGDGAHHKRKIESADDGSGVQLANGLWANIVHSGEVNVSWFGAKGDGVTDDTATIQKALDFADKIFFDKGIFCISEHLLINNKNAISKNIEGLGDSSVIKKIKNSNFVDNDNPEYLVDSCIIITRTNNISKGLIMKNLTLDANGISKNCIYSMQNYRTRIENINMNKYTDIGFYDTGSFVSNYINLSTVGTENSNISFYKKNTGTSTTYMNCYSRESKVGFDICGQYTNLINCAVDHYSVCAYRIGEDTGSDYHNRDSSTITLQGCGAEKFRGEPCNVIELHRGSNVSIDGFMSYSAIKMKSIVELLGERVKLSMNNVYHFIADFFILDNFNQSDITLNNIYYQGATDELESRIGVNTVLKNLRRGYSVRRGSGNQGVTVGFAGIFTNNPQTATGLMLDGKEVKTFYADCSRTENESYGIFTINTGKDLASSGYTVSNLGYVASLSYASAHLEKRTASFNVVSIDGSNITFALQGFKNGTADTYWNKYGVSVTIFLNRNSVSSLGSEYHTTKMQQFGVYEDFISYMDSQHKYDKEQKALESAKQEAYQLALVKNSELVYEDWLASYPELMPVHQEPVPSERLMEFYNEYK